MTMCEYSQGLHSTSDSTVECFSFPFGHDPKQRVSIEDGLRGVGVFMFDEFVFEYRNLSLVFDVKVSRYGLDGIGRLGDTIVCMRHRWMLGVLEDMSAPQSWSMAYI